MKIIKDYLTPNKYSRPQDTGKYKFIQFRGVALHWYENAGQGAQGAWDWFESAPIRKRYGSAQYTVDDRSAVQLMPEDEMAYHVGATSYTPLAYERDLLPYPNCYLIGVEMSHPDWTGKPSPLTRHYTVGLLVDIFARHPERDPMKDIYLHSQITGKISKRGFQCHRYYMDNPEEFLHLKTTVKERLIAHEEFGYDPK